MGNNQNIECTKGGKAKKAPYETTHARIPTEIKTTVETISNSYKELKQNDDNQGINELLNKVNDVVIAGNAINDNSLADDSEVKAKLMRLEQIEAILADFEGKAIDKEKSPRFDQLIKLLAQVNQLV